MNIRDVYKRFKENYRTETGGINIYPGFDRDLNILLAAFSHFDEESPQIDCSWRPPYGEDD